MSDFLADFADCRLKRSFNRFCTSCVIFLSVFCHAGERRLPVCRSIFSAHHVFMYCIMLSPHCISTLSRYASDSDHQPRYKWSQVLRLIVPSIPHVGLLIIDHGWPIFGHLMGRSHRSMLREF